MSGRGEEDVRRRCAERGRGREGLVAAGRPCGRPRALVWRVPQRVPLAAGCAGGARLGRGTAQRGVTAVPRRLPSAGSNWNPTLKASFARDPRGLARAWLR